MARITVRAYSIYAFGELQAVNEPVSAAVAVNEPVSAAVMDSRFC